jgi:hypothetical protein
MTAEHLLIKLFESQKENAIIGRGGKEISGLKLNSVPENCTVIGSFVRKMEEDRTFYLVDIDDCLVLMRICKANKSICGYDEFVVIHNAANSQEEKQKIKETFERWNF